MRLCDSIDTLAMAYLDDELATEERHELETHLLDCTACLIGPRTDHDLLRSRGARERPIACARKHARTAERDDVRAGARSGSGCWRAILPRRGVLVLSGGFSRPACASVVKAGVRQQLRRSRSNRFLRSPPGSTCVGEAPQVEGSQVILRRLLPGKCERPRCHAVHSTSITVPHRPIDTHDR